MSNVEHELLILVNQLLMFPSLPVSLLGYQVSVGPRTLGISL